MRITNAYFVPDAQLLAALQAAAQRGVDVTLILPSQTDSWLAFHAEFGAQVQAMFDKDLAQSQRISLEDWERRGIDLRVKELLARVWAYWL